jgi:hypothetical protein
MNTDRGPGFYKYDSEELLYAQNYVLSGDYNLYTEQKIRINTQLEDGIGLIPKPKQDNFLIFLH